MSLLAAKREALERLEPRRICGSVAAVRGLTLLVDDLPLPIGAVVRVEGPRGGCDRPTNGVRGEVIGLSGPQAMIMLTGSSDGIARGMNVIGEQALNTVPVSRSLLGRVIDAFGRPLDGSAVPFDAAHRPLHARPTAALRRRAITEPMPTGVRAVDAMLTLGKGQRIGIFSGAGVGKSTLLAAMARHTAADVCVIGLVGERGREVRDFIDHALGPRGLARSVVVVATGDESPLLRVRAAWVACAVAEHFRDEGADVLLMMDSVTRFAQAQRQIGLAVGEQPATKGYTPSVFALLPVLLERAGAIEGVGSITGIYAVLVDGDDLNEPVSDAARGVLDGHIALSRRLAGRGHYPAVDLLESISRVADDVCDANHIAARRRVRRLLAAHAEMEELINIGAYARGSSPECDLAIAMKPAIDRFLMQAMDERADYPLTCRALVELMVQSEEQQARLAAPAPGTSMPRPAPRR
jgi:flagellum-specific ATP synthase